MEDKHNFEHFAAKQEVKVEHYHADNGVFANSFVMQEIKQIMQRISFGGVNAHHQMESEKA